MIKKKKIIEANGHKYVLERPIGNGGSGTVWAATSNNQEFAIKFVNSDNESKIRRFEDEISFCKKTNHKNILKVIADGRNDNKPYYIMSLYTDTFRNVIDNETDANKLIKYILNICNAIKYIHGKKVIHRDIKPENILIKENELVLADFGISHFKNNGLTKENDLLANRNYMAPEQKLKNNATNVRMAADIYALGLIINECFTKQNPSGSQFKIIADFYPLLSDLDILVEGMIRQNYKERLNIDAVYTELKFIWSKFREDHLELRSFLYDQNCPIQITNVLRKKILKQATEDILIAKKLFYTSSLDDFQKYNHNWHMRIGYSVDDILFNLYVQEEIFWTCKSKFEYETNVYRKNNWYQTLDLENNAAHLSLYQKMASILAKYKFANSDGSLLDLSGAALKYFSSCADYHCKEILQRVEQIERLAEENLKDVPIIWIVARLRYGIKENIRYLFNGVDRLGGKHGFYFSDHILINWDRAAYYVINRDDDSFLDKTYLEKEEKEREILAIAELRWKIKSKIINIDYCSVKFQKYSQYLKFRHYALQLAKPYYIFEGDVLKIFSDHKLIGNMVELKLSRVFDIHNTLAKIVGLKEI